jgi:hypothetical protein
MTALYLIPHKLLVLLNPYFGIQTSAFASVTSASSRVNQSSFYGTPLIYNISSHAHEVNRKIINIFYFAIFA